ncbi:CCA tRNA nucleotidyltransferase [Sulfitobacter sp. JB4-11]|uniref:CCA tRNA nucleotidyltransferase n=1 Tax=Sulfitobacter rhodophyticola TaxID=3238304 RepID=UPI003511352D
MDRTHDPLIPPETSWLTDPQAQAVCDAITSGGHAIYFVGGCVRNALLGMPDSDVDMSTDALPEQVMALATDAGLKAVPTGIDHGTVTVVSNGVPFEVTTFRRDVETDGRRAVVAFSKDIADDARRRDFTMNALYATPQGQVIDPLGGLPDLRARRLRFIEEPQARIREDYLRILRFFRFSAYFGDTSDGFDAEALDAIAQNIDGLNGLSAERIGQEMSKLLAASDPAPALAVMRQVNVLQAILPGSDDRWVGPMVHLEGALGISADWRGRLAALGGQDVAARFRLSKADARFLGTLGDVGFAGPSLGEVSYRHGRDIALQVLLMRSALAEVMPDTTVLETISSADAAQFPVKAADLIPRWEGPALGAKLAELEQIWIDADFGMSKEALLAQL